MTTLKLFVSTAFIILTFSTPHAIRGMDSSTNNKYISLLDREKERKLVRLAAREERYQESLSIVSTDTQGLTYEPRVFHDESMRKALDKIDSWNRSLTRNRSLTNGSEYDFEASLLSMGIPARIQELRRRADENTKPRLILEGAYDCTGKWGTQLKVVYGPDKNKRSTSHVFVTHEDHGLFQSLVSAVMEDMETTHKLYLECHGVPHPHMETTHRLYMRHSPYFRSVLVSPRMKAPSFPVKRASPYAPVAPSPVKEDLSRVPAAPPLVSVAPSPVKEDLSRVPAAPPLVSVAPSRVPAASPLVKEAPPPVRAPSTGRVKRRSRMQPPPADVSTKLERKQRKRERKAITAEQQGANQGGKTQRPMNTSQSLPVPNPDTVNDPSPQATTPILEKKLTLWEDDFPFSIWEDDFPSSIKHYKMQTQISPSTAPALGSKLERKQRKRERKAITAEQQGANQGGKTQRPMNTSQSLPVPNPDTVNDPSPQTTTPILEKKPTLWEDDFPFSIWEDDFPSSIEHYEMQTHISPSTAPALGSKLERIKEMHRRQKETSEGNFPTCVESSSTSATSSPLARRFPPSAKAPSSAVKEASPLMSAVPSHVPAAPQLVPSASPSVKAPSSLMKKAPPPVKEQCCTLS